LKEKYVEDKRLKVLLLRREMEIKSIQEKLEQEVCKL